MDEVKASTVKALRGMLLPDGYNRGVLMSAAAEIERQQARIQALEQERDHYRMAAEAEARFADEARAKVRDLEQDAARYRFARDNIMPGYELPGGFYLTDTGDGWDATIDAARKEKGHG